MVEPSDMNQEAFDELSELGVIIGSQVNGSYIMLDLQRLYMLGLQLIWTNEPVFISTASLCLTSDVTIYTCPLIPIKSLWSYKCLKIKPDMFSGN